MNITILLTENCNLKCTYCYEQDFSERKNMDLITMKKVAEFILDQVKIKQPNYLGITLLGGEPLLNLDGVNYFINRFKEEKTTYLNISFRMTTNGTILNENVLKVLPLIDFLSVSIDGDKDVHDRNRVFPNLEGSFDTVFKNIKKILSINPNTAARMTITKKNVSKLFENVRFLIECGFHYISPNLDFTDRDWEDNDAENLIDQMMKVSDLIKTKKVQSNPVEIPLFSYLKRKRRNGNCSGGKDSFAISASGDIYPCSVIMSMEEWKIGNVFQGLELTSLEKLEEISKTDTLSCAGCSRYEYCNGPRCKLIDFKYTGHYDQPLEAFCIYENIGYRLGKVQ